MNTKSIHARYREGGLVFWVEGHHDGTLWQVSLQLISPPVGRPLTRQHADLLVVIPDLVNDAKAWLSKEPPEGPDEGVREKMDEIARLIHGASS